jgi:hypothetical protein
MKGTIIRSSISPAILNGLKTVKKTANPHRIERVQTGNVARPEKSHENKNDLLPVKDIFSPCFRRRCKKGYEEEGSTKIIVSLDHFPVETTALDYHPSVQQKHVTH